MGTVYGSMDKDIEAFMVFKVVGRQLLPAPEIVNICCYDHFWYQLHHYIKAQQYKSRMDWFIDNGINQKLILMPAIMHEQLESPIYGLSDKDFYRRWGIKKELLLFDKKKWIAEQLKGERK